MAAGLIECSCGVPGCPELGWPHEWDPIAAGDSCSLSNGTRPVGIVIRDGKVVTQVVIDHFVTEPYVRWGSGYACVECVERQTRNCVPVPA